MNRATTQIFLILLRTILLKNMTKHAQKAWAFILSKRKGHSQPTRIAVQLMISLVNGFKDSKTVVGFYSPPKSLLQHLRIQKIQRTSAKIKPRLSLKAVGQTKSLNLVSKTTIQFSMVKIEVVMTEVTLH